MDEDNDNDKEYDNDNDKEYDKTFEIDDMILIVIDDTESIGKVKEIENDLNTITFIIDGSDIIFKTDENYNIILKTEDYTIIDIEKIVSFDFEGLDAIINTLLTKDIYPDIEIITENVTDYIYTDVEKRESLISSLIISMKIYDDPNKIKAITNISQIFIDMIKNNTDTSLKHFEEINSFKQNKKLPYWLIPISTDIKRLYLEETDTDDYGRGIEDDIIKVDFTEEIKEINDIYNSNNKYQNMLDIYNNTKYKPIQNLLIENGYKLNEYEYDYFRSCITKNTCTGINGKYNVDTRKNNKGLKIYDNDIIKTLIDIPVCNISSLLYLSDDINIRLPFRFDSKILSLREKCLFMENNYSIESNNIRINNLRIQNIDCNIDRDIIFNYDSDVNYDSKNSYIYNINETINLGEFTTILDKYIPNQNTILDKFMYDNYYDVLYNYDDFSKLMIKYNLNISNITPTNKSKINKIINKNIKTYINSYNSNDTKIKYERKILKENKYTQQDKLKLLLDYIHKLIDIPYQNYLYDKFIKNFTILNKDKKTFDSKYNNTPLLCEHYLYQSKTDKDPTSYDTLISKYGLKKDGEIYCKVCGRYLDNVELSNFEGFSDDKPVFKEAIVVSNPDIDFTDLHKFIILLGKHIGVQLNDDDVVEIYDLYQIINDNQLSDFRFDVNESMNKNNQLIQNIYKMKNITASLKQKNILNVQKYIIETNKLLFLYSCILIFIQTSIPSYSINLMIIDISNDSYLTNPKINKLLIHKSLKLLNTLNKLYENNIYFKYLDDFFDDGNPDRSNIDPDVQLENTIKYILSPYFSKILDKIKKFKIYRGYYNNVYLKEYWNVYRPLPTNKDIISINKIIDDSIIENNDYLISNTISKYKLENISMLIGLNKSEKTEKYKSVDIKNIEILNNKSFLRLYDFILSLNGYQLINKYKNNYIELLINRLYETSGKDKYIHTIFNAYDWKVDNKISFKELRKILIGIFKYCRDKGDCIKSLKIFNHIELWNNIHLNYSNIYPKRTYSYNVFSPVPDLPFDLLKDQQNIIKFYDIYCYDINDKIIKRGNMDVFYRSLYIKTDYRYNPCKENLSISDTHFDVILNKIYKQNKYNEIYEPYIKRRINDNYIKSDIKEFEDKNLIEQRLINVLNVSDLKRIPILYDLLLTINGYIETDELSIEGLDDLRKLLDKQFNVIIDDTKCMIENVIEFINTNINIDIAKKSSINVLLDILNDLDINDIYLINNIENTLLLISKIKNNKMDNNTLPKSWKLSEYNMETFVKFLQQKQYLLHDDIFNPKPQKSKMNGFDVYLNDSKIFSDLYNMYENFNKYLNLIVGKKDNIFLDTYAKYLLKYMFALMLYKIVEFIKLEDNCNIEEDGNELYNVILEDIDINQIKNETILSKFLGDIALNIIQEYTDIKWLIQIEKNNGFLQTKLAEQKENEKQIFISKLDKMSGSDLYVFKELQNTGISNWYDESEKINQEIAEGVEFDELVEDNVVDLIEDNGYQQDELGQDDQGDDQGDDQDDPGDYQD